MLHALDVASPDEVSTGMRVQVRWADERVGAITDIACFEPATHQGPRNAANLQSRDRTVIAQGADPVTGVITPSSSTTSTPPPPRSRRSTAASREGRLLGQRCPTCQKVYVPPRSACPADGTPTTDEVELPDKGTVTTFCIVNVPFLGQKITPPYVSAYVLLDGADIAFLHLILDIPAEEVRMGMRVEAVWKPREEWGTTIENISHFRPTGRARRGLRDLQAAPLRGWR